MSWPALIFFRFDRRLLGELLGCAWRAWRAWLEASFEESFEPGGVGFVQTAGELVGFHPHVHLLVTDGGFLPDGSFRHLLWVDEAAVERLWRAEVLRLLVERGKIGQEVVVHPRPSRRGGPLWESERLDVLDFLARVLDPVPEPGQQQVRDWGWDSNAARGKRRKAELGVEGPLAASVSADGDRSSRRRRVSWARLIQRVSVRRQGETGLACAARARASQWLAVRPQIDPLLCRYCGGEMRLVAFVVEVSSLRRLLDGLGPGPQEAEPLSRAPPVEGQLVYEAVEG